MNAPHLHGERRLAADRIVRSLVCLGAAAVRLTSPPRAFGELYGPHPDALFTSDTLARIDKAAQPPASTSNSAALVQQTVVAFVDLLRTESVVAQLGLMKFASAGPLRVPSRSSSTPNLAGGFRAEAAPIRIGALHLGGVELSPNSLGVISTFSQELFNASAGTIETVVRACMVADTTSALDGAFFGLGAGVPGEAPPGIGFGAGSAPSTGSDAAAIVSDLQGRLQALAAQGATRSPAWVMSSSNLFYLSLLTATDGSRVFPEVAQGLIGTVPVLAGDAIPSDTVFLFDAAEVAFAAGLPRYTAAQEATLHEEDADPAAINDAALAVPVREIYQTATLALRGVWAVSWAPLRAGVVQLLTAVTWGTP